MDKSWQVQSNSTHPGNVRGQNSPCVNAQLLNLPSWKNISNIKSWVTGSDKSVETDDKPRLNLETHKKQSSRHLRMYFELARPGVRGWQAWIQLWCAPVLWAADLTPRTWVAAAESQSDGAAAALVRCRQTWSKKRGIKAGRRGRGLPKVSRVYTKFGLSCAFLLLPFYLSSMMGEGVMWVMFLIKLTRLLFFSFERDETVSKTFHKNLFKFVFWCL